VAHKNAGAARQVEPAADCPPESRRRRTRHCDRPAGECILAARSAPRSRTPRRLRANQVRKVAGKERFYEQTVASAGCRDRGGVW
jgi:hypothetical protein